MNYQFKDFKDCVFNPMEAKLLEKYPRLVDIFGLMDERTVKILRYAMACYDPASPLVQDYPEWAMRKQAAAQVAGFDLDADEDEEFLDKLFSCEDEKALEVVHTFLRRCIRSRKWAMIVSCEETFWEYNQRLKEPISKGEKGSDKDMMAAIEKKSKLAADQEALDERIERYKKAFYGGDEELQKASEMHFTPEQIAKQLSNKR